MAGQDDDFRNAVMGNVDGGYVPAYAPAPAIGVSPEQQAQESERFRALMSAGIAGIPGVGALAPYADGINIGAKTFGAISNPLSAVMGATEGLMQPGVARRAGQAALGLAHERPDGVTTRTRDAEPSDLRPMNTQVDVQPSPTLGQMSAPARAPVGGMGGGGGFGGLAQGLRDAQGREMKGYDDMSELYSRLGIDKAGAALAEGDMREADALARMRDAENNARIEAAAQERHQAFLTRQEQLADEIGKQVVDPGRLMRNADLGTQVTFGLGSALGEMFSSNGRNSYLDRVDQQIKQDIESQVSGNDAKRRSYDARQSLFDKMLAESGDRRLAGMQTQKMMYDAIDKKLTADAARLGVPEIMTGAAIKSQEYQQKKQALDVQIQAASLQQARAAAAAQAASQRAAEDRLRQHTVEMIKLQQEQQKIDISRDKDSGKSDEGARHIASQLQSAGVPQARTAAEEALAALQKSPGGKADAFARGVLGGAATSVMPEESNAREQKYQAYVNAAMKAMLGNVTESELARAEKQFGTANNPESRERAIRSSLATLDAIERNAKGGESTAAQRLFDERRAAASGNRAPAFVPDKPKGAQ